MTVKELIDRLEKVEDKSVQCWIMGDAGKCETVARVYKYSDGFRIDCHQYEQT